MVKAIFLIKRKPGLTMEEFKNHYERFHVDVALEFIRPFLQGYRRNYPTSSTSYFDTVENSPETAPPAFDYDCVTEMWFESEEVLQNMFERLSEPDVRAIVGADEDRFLDPQSVVCIRCEEHSTAL